MFPFAHTAWQPFECAEPGPQQRQQGSATAGDPGSAPTEASPPPPPPQATTTSTELAIRFAQMMAFRATALWPVAMNDEEHKKNDAVVPRRLRVCRVSKNCRSLLRERRRLHASMLAEKAALEASVADLKRSLVDDHAPRRIHPSRPHGTLVEVKEYLRVFATTNDANDANNSTRATQEVEPREFILGIIDHGRCVCRDARSIDSLRHHIAAFTMGGSHGELTIELVAVTLLLDGWEEEIAGLQAAGTKHSIVTDHMLRELYPGLYAEAQCNPAMQMLADALVGNPCRVDSDEAVHFSGCEYSCGQETRLHVVANLRGLVPGLTEQSVTTWPKDSRDHVPGYREPLSETRYEERAK